jgi:hypothetical protein
MPFMKKKQHFRVYQPVYKQLQRVWTSTHAASLLAYETQYENWRH